MAAEASRAAAREAAASADGKTGREGLSALPFFDCAAGNAAEKFCAFRFLDS